MPKNPLEESFKGSLSHFLDHEKFEMRKKALDVFLKLARDLQPFRENIVLIGGWLPFFLSQTGRPGQLSHSGSYDIDLLLRPEYFKKKTNELLEVLEKNNFYHLYNGPRFTYYCDIEREGQEPLIIKADLVCGDYYVNDQPVRYRKLKGLTLRTARAGKLSLIDPVDISVDYAGGFVQFRMVNPLAFLILKGMVMSERERLKDSYDVYYLLKVGNVDAKKMKERYRELIDHPVIREGLVKLFTNFHKPDSPGCFAVPKFLGVDRIEDVECFRMDAWHTIHNFLEELELQPKNLAVDFDGQIEFSSIKTLMPIESIQIDYLDLIDNLFCGSCRNNLNPLRSLLQSALPHCD